MYAALDPDVGYTQGMSFMAALFLLYMVEEEAFYCFYSVMKGVPASHITVPKFPLRNLYLHGLPETHRMLYVFNGLGDQFLDELWGHLSEVGLRPEMYFTNWFMSMFSSGFSFDLVTRVWDIFLSEGSMKIVYRVSLAILKYFSKELLSYSFEKIMALMRELPKHIDASAVMDLAWKIPLRQAHIAHHEKVIERDVDRTFPRHMIFIESNGQGQNSLRRILQLISPHTHQAYASLDPE
eukprot:gene27176-33862_t